jgi:PAS domain-containing protein
MTDAINRPIFRSAAAQMRLAEGLYRRLFEDSPHPYLILSPNLRIADANAAYLSATETSRDALAGRHMFEAFPDNPDDPEANGVRNLGASFERLFSSLRKDAMPLQRYDVRGSDGAWLLRYWHPVNWPLVDEARSVIAIVHHVTSATTQGRTHQRPMGPDAATEPGRRSRTAELLARAKESNLKAQDRISRSEMLMERADALLRRSRRRTPKE